MADYKPMFDEQTIYLGDGWTLRARIERGMEDTPHGRVGSHDHVLQFTVVTPKHPDGVRITATDAQALLALRGALGMAATIPTVAPEKTTVQVGPAPTRPRS